MARTRSAVLAGALRAVEVAGSRRATMTDVAVHGGVAKATVYNHFRTKTDVYAALVQSEVRTLGQECAERAEGAPGQPGARDGLAEAVEHAAVRLSEHRALRRLAADEPEVLARLLQPDGGPAWQEARSAADRVLRATGREPSAAAVDAVLRAVVTHVPWPADRPSAALSADVLARGLPPGPAAAPAPAAAGGGLAPTSPVDPTTPAAPGDATAPTGPLHGTAPAEPSAPAGEDPPAGQERRSGEDPAETGLGWPG